MKSRAPAAPHSPNWLARTAVALLAASAIAAASHANAGVYLSVNIAPPALPVYEQPLIPGEGYIWTPGYWSWDADANDYFWVPGTWVRPPTYGVLWTPGYWGWNEGLYEFHPGYWGPHIGYYGGINYGYGYVGVGYVGGYWGHGGFYYNTAINHFGPDVRITNVYNRTVINNITVNNYSFNGPGGAVHTMTREETLAEREHHVAPGHEQLLHVEAARHDETLRSSVNHGKPALAATSHPGAFEHGHEVAHPMVTYQVPHQNEPAHNAQGDQHMSQHHQPAQVMNDGQQMPHHQSMQQQYAQGQGHAAPMNQGPHGPNPNQAMHMQAPHQPQPRQPAPRPNEGKQHDDHKH